MWQAAHRPSKDEVQVQMYSARMESQDQEEEGGAPLWHDMTWGHEHKGIEDKKKVQGTEQTWAKAPSVLPQQRC